VFDSIYDTHVLISNTQRTNVRALCAEDDSRYSYWHPPSLPLENHNKIWQLPSCSLRSFMVCLTTLSVFHTVAFTFEMALPIKWSAFMLQIVVILTLSLLMSNLYGAPCKAINFNVVYIYGFTFANAKSRLFLFAPQRFNIESMQKVFLRHSCV
jgi:hypothetical protein